MLTLPPSECLTLLQTCILKVISEAGYDGIKRSELKKRVLAKLGLSDNSIDYRHGFYNPLVRLHQLKCVERIYRTKGIWRIKEPMGTYMLERSLELYRRVLT